MIMRELKTGLQTSGCYTRHYPPCGQDINIGQGDQGTISTGRKVRE